jgi:class 3 adenylate cyclase
MAVLAGIVLIGALVGLVVVGLRYRQEQREGARVRALFSRYVAPPVVDELLRRKDPRLYTGRSLQATIVVCRIWNFAGFAEDLTPEETLRYLNEFFALAGTTIQKHLGMIDKFLSDGIIGVFGVPLEDPAAEEHALRAALDIVRLVDAMDQRWRAQGRRSFQVGIGINSGEVIAGDAGFHERREFTVVGPETLFAARLQEATSELPAFVIAAASTCAPVRDIFSLVPLTGHPLPGIKRLVDAFIVLGLTKDTQTLTMPAAAAFKETQVEGPRPPLAVDAARATPPLQAGAQLKPTPAAQPSLGGRVTPPPPEIAPSPRIELADPLTPLRPRRRSAQNTPDSAFTMPNGFARPTDAEPIFPEIEPPPGRRSAYEDGSGPPIQLPR